MLLLNSSSPGGTAIEREMRPLSCAQDSRLSFTHITLPLYACAANFIAEFWAIISSRSLLIFTPMGLAPHRDPLEIRIRGVRCRPFRAGVPVLHFASSLVRAPNESMDDRRRTMADEHIRPVARRKAAAQDLVRLRTDGRGR